MSKKGLTEEEEKPTPTSFQLRETSLTASHSLSALPDCTTCPLIYIYGLREDEKKRRRRILLFLYYSSLSLRLEKKIHSTSNTQTYFFFFFVPTMQQKRALGLSSGDWFT